jgi:hypothetical protein
MNNEQIKIDKGPVNKLPLIYITVNTDIESTFAI